MSEDTCRNCGTKGFKVLPLTLGVHLGVDHWDKIDENFYFCPSPECEVVYFNNISGVYFKKSEIKTRVGIKEREEPKPLCYCNRVTEQMIKEAAERGYSAEEIIDSTGAGRGKWCIVTNPSGRCCEWYLKDIISRYAEGGKTSKKRKKFKELELEIKGMTCEGCAGVVRAVLENSGAEKVKISLENGKAEMLIPSEERVEKFVRAVREAGYSAVVRKVEQ